MSKELEALERIKKFYPTWRLSNREAFNLVESALKALEIIKEKEVDISVLKDSPNLAHYNRHFDYSDYQKLTRQLSQEEFDILKEALQ